MQLPLDFLAEMKSMLGSEYESFVNCCNAPYKRGLRVNTLKTDAALLKQKLNISDVSPFCDFAYYISDDRRLGNHPLHHAGAFYLQEPSAASAVTVLDVKKGDKVLDLCAAPGGKSTQIGSLLAGEGLLWSNEIVRSRASVLLSNIERMGIRNAVVSSCHPDVLCDTLGGFFDKVLVDAPCSGEGMFRKNPESIVEWSAEHVKSCAVRQLSILNSAKKAVKNGGTIVYSTCTFSREENEEVIEKFLSENKNFALEDCNVSFGRPVLEKARRILPMDGGEGHFTAKLKKLDGDESTSSGMFNMNENDIQMCKAAEILFEDIFTVKPYGRLFCKNGRGFILPDGLPDINGLGVLRAGVEFCQIKKNRTEPLHCAYTASRANENRNIIDLDCDDKDIYKFMHGEEINAAEDIKGFTAVAVNGIVLGFGKCSNGVLKNRYPKGLRTL